MKPRPFSKEVLDAQDERRKRALIGDHAYEKLRRRRKPNALKRIMLTLIALF